jgi:O-antigen ligase
VLGIGALMAGAPSMFVSRLGVDPTLSGRTSVWREVIKAISEHPWLGYGFQSFWGGLTAESTRIVLTLDWNFGYAHNGFLEVLLQVGLVGLGFVLYLLFKSMRDAMFCFRYSTNSGIYWYIGLLVLTLFYNLDEETFLFPHQLVTILFLVACCGLATSRKEAICAARNLFRGASEDKPGGEILVSAQLDHPGRQYTKQTEKRSSVGS